MKLKPLKVRSHRLTALEGILLGELLAIMALLIGNLIANHGSLVL